GIQADGKIVVAGNAETGTNNVFALARYNPDGSLDSSFDADGKVLTTFGADTSSANAIAIQPDQKILAAGGANGDFALARYNANGSLDASFGTSGKVTTSIGAGRDNAHALALQKDGKIVVVGERFNGADDDFAVAR